MTIQTQLVQAGLVSEETRAKLEAEKRSRNALINALNTLHSAAFIARGDLAAMQPPELTRYHETLEDLRLHVVAVTRHSIRFAVRPQRSYIAFCYAARRRFDREQARKARQR